MKQKILYTIIVMLLFPPFTIQAHNTVDLQPLEESVQAQLDALDLGNLLRFAELLEREYQDFLPGLNWRDLLSKDNRTSPGELLQLLISNFLRELYLNVHFLRQLIVLGILASLLQRLSASFGTKSMVNLAFGVCFLIFIVVGLQSFQIILALATATVDKMVSFMQAILPMLSTLLMAVGGITSATIFHPILWGLVGGIANLVHYLIFPLILFSTVFRLVAHFTPDLPFSKLGDLIRQSVTTILSFFFIVFSGFMVVKGAIAPVADGVTLRAAKYFTRTFIPIVGGVFADTVEVVVGGSLLIKNGIGVFGLVMLILILLTPVLKMLASIFIYKIVGVLLEPICDFRMVEALSIMESSLSLVLISLCAVTLMFLLCISILVGLGNLAVFLR